jgi:hypothetical protein
VHSIIWGKSFNGSYLQGIFRDRWMNRDSLNLLTLGTGLTKSEIKYDGYLKLTSFKSMWTAEDTIDKNF